MKRILSILLALSLGLNLGLLYVQFQGQPAPGPGLRPGPEGQRPGPGRRPGPEGRQRPHRPQDPRVMIEGHMKGLTRHVDLTPDQQVALRAVLEATMPDLAAATAETRAANAAISREFARADFDAQRFEELVLEAAAARSRADSLSGVMLLGEAGVLTMEQRARYAEVAPTIHTGGGGAIPPPPPRRK